MSGTAVYPSVPLADLFSAMVRRLRRTACRSGWRGPRDYAPEQHVRDTPDAYYGGAAGFERVLDLTEAGARAHTATHRRGEPAEQAGAVIAALQAELRIVAA